MIGEFRECLYPWIIVGEEDDTTATIRSFNNIRQGLDNLLACKISWHEYLDIVESEGVDMDEYLDLAGNNIITAGF